MPMMPPDADLKQHLANRRSLAQARDAYIGASPDEQASPSDVHESRAVQEEIKALRRETRAVQGDASSTLLRFIR